MDYKQTIDYLYSQLPMFQRVGAPAYKADLSNTIAACKLTGNPERDFPAIHIAGTNGKGSTANMLASVLTQAGFKTGLFTSPHLKDFRERIRIDGALIDKDYVVGFVDSYAGAASAFGASFFELTFAMAMKYFSDSKIDIAVVEVGMGGRLDSTNVVKSILSVITNISLDHTAFLGSDLESVAAEKAGIIKPRVPVVLGRKQAETAVVFKDFAARNDAPLFYAEDLVSLEVAGGGRFSFSFDKKTYHSVNMPLKGDYQQENLRTALAALKILSGKNGFETLSEVKYIINGLEKIIENTGFAGRWQILSQQPLIICDTGHNIDGMKRNMEQLTAMKYENLHMVIGMVGDKDAGSVLSLMPVAANYYFCKADIPRGMPARELKKIAGEHRLRGEVYESVGQAYNAAKANAESDDIIFVGGSTFVVAEVLQG